MATPAGDPFAVNGYLGYAAPAEPPADGTGVRRVAAIAVLDHPSFSPSSPFRS